MGQTEGLDIKDVSASATLLQVEVSPASREWTLRDDLNVRRNRKYFVLAEISKVQFQHHYSSNQF